jgi:hypothetical protein
MGVQEGKMSTADIKEVIVLGASGGFGTLFSQVSDRV